MSVETEPGLTPAMLRVAARVSVCWRMILAHRFSPGEIAVLAVILEFSYSRGRLFARFEKLDQFYDLTGITRGNVLGMLERLLEAKVILDGPSGSRSTTTEHRRDWTEI